MNFKFDMVLPSRSSPINHFSNCTALSVGSPSVSSSSLFFVDVVRVACASGSVCVYVCGGEMVVSASCLSSKET